MNFEYEEKMYVPAAELKKDIFSTELFFRVFIIASFLFFFGCILGWLIELFFRRYISKKNHSRKWLNPGFLVGPYLPLYGFGTVLLYLLSMFQSKISGYIENEFLFYIFMFFIMALAMTLLEYVAGIIFIKGMHIRLWDYRKEWCNIQGIVCPKFTAFWGCLCVLYYFFIYPKLYVLVLWFMNHPWFSFVVGIIFGIFIVDCCVSLHLGTLIRKKMVEIDRKTDLDFVRIQSSIKMQKISIHSRESFTSRFDRIEEFVRRTPASQENKNEL